MKITNLITDTVKPLLTKKVNLAPIQKKLVESFFKTNKIIIYLDDLDRGWHNRKEGIIMISALLNSIRDLSYLNPSLSFKLSLRSDVYAAIRFEDESSDKITGSVVWQSYTLHEIFVMLIIRVLTFIGESVNEKNLLQAEQRHLSYNLESIMATTFTGTGTWTKAPIRKVLLSLTRKRPRDLVKLCSLAARKAYKEKSNIIMTHHFESIFEEYSQGVIHDTIVEYKSELLDIERLLFGMKPAKKQLRTSESFTYTTPELRLKINNIIQGGNFLFANGKSASAQELSQFLFKINFLTARKTLEDGTIQRKYFEENNYLSSSFVDFGYDWEVHLAYRWALQPDSLENIFNKFSLSAD